MKKVPLLFLALLCFSLSAQIPKTLSFQGYLTNDAGEPITNTALNVSFSIFDAEAEGTRLWGPELKDLNVDRGIFSTILGSTTPLSLDFDQTYYLEIVIDPSGTPETLDRIQLTSSAYSISTVNAANITENQLAISQGGTGAVSADAARTNLGLVIGTDVQAQDDDLEDLADGTLSGTKVGTGINADNISDGTLAIVQGGTGANTATDARTSLGLEIGADVQAYDSDLTTYAGITPSPDVIAVLRANNNDGILDSLGIDISGAVQPLDDGLTSISGLTTTADQMLYITGEDAYTTTSLTGFGRSILDDTDENLFKQTVNLEPGVDIQAFNSALNSIAGVTTTANNLIYTTAPNTYEATSLTAFGRSILDDTDAGEFRSTVDLEPGIDIQVFDAGLNSIAGLTTAADEVIYTTGLDSYNVTSLTAFGRSIIDDATEGDFKATVNLEPGTDVQAYDVGLNSIAELTTSADQMIYTTASDTYTTTSISSFGRSIIDDANESTFKATVNLEPGTDIQAYDAGLNDIAALTPSTDQMLYTIGSNDYSTTSLTSFARSILDDGNEATFKSTVNLEIGTDVQAYDADLASIAKGASNASTGTNAIAIGQNNDADGANSIVIGSYARTSSTGTGSVYIGDRSVSSTTSGTAANRFYARFENGYALYTNDDLSTGVSATNGATSWSSLSDSTKKENFQNIDGENFLSKFEKLKLGTWNYKSLPDSRREYGPYAQDFFLLFGDDGIGHIGNDTLISTQAISGVNITAIKALVIRTNELKKENEELKSIINEMRSNLEDLENLKRKVNSMLGNLEKEEKERKNNSVIATTKF